MSQNLICTPFELKQFAFSLSGENPTAFNFTRFVESKSGYKYTVIEMEFLIDSFRILEEQVQFFSELHANFQEKWEHLNVLRLKASDLKHVT